ncbi:MAG TPA: hypothetical protein VMK12_22630, partial [Anaeromyxobacteraceae bacterium]|nr:hypothetical protein [Anaeromyxobacteraceae bacterium]
MRWGAIFLSFLAGLNCFPRVSVPDSERQRASHELEDQVRFTKVALYIGPFFADTSKLLVSDQPFDELDLLETPRGEVILPPRPERVLPPGTRVRIQKVEFPTGWIIAKRNIMSPRYHPWVYLSLEGEPRPLLQVLPQALASAEEVRVELERVLGASDPSAAYLALPDGQRAAIRRKELEEGMSPQAVEMAWGYPEKKHIDRPANTEQWV